MYVSIGVRCVYVCMCLKTVSIGVRRMYASVCLYVCDVCMYVCVPTTLEKLKSLTIGGCCVYVCVCLQTLETLNYRCVLCVCMCLKTLETLNVYLWAQSSQAPNSWLLSSTP